MLSSDTRVDVQEQGYVDEAGKLRKIPFEVMVRGDKIPIYGETLEDNGRFNEVQHLPEAESRRDDTWSSQLV